MVHMDFLAQTMKIQPRPFREDPMTFHATTPELVPVLSRGKHRNARRGACFMEMASFLAGERWSDHPSCTHPLLAGDSRLTVATMVSSVPSQPDRSPCRVDLVALVGRTGSLVRHAGARQS